ncbi:HNH endonuclease family protein [Rhodococcus chondri]|uniref:HNH endonuclease family protein n=1 Tax=Rhodococcus chondri TaxID=3065941 RepID=A0ABU7JVR9_9NOCA|nr:HNH endonuclease family protein [Rhodococcus sp. CC-R104]MEE2034128.1 HNH endonuclease family protein [Rhodococcus sp. CC-R104]
MAFAIAVSWWWDFSESADPVPGSPSRTQVEELLGRVEVVAQRPQLSGYERDCGPGARCVFGPAWSDDHPGPGGHDGCDTRNNVLARDLRDPTFRSGTDDCVVLTGTLADPYTGEQVAFRRSAAKAVHIDHIYPLAAAWDHGAAHWPAELRQQFANDVVYNLAAVGGAANEAKRDHTPAEWLPPATGYRCWFAGKYLSVAVRYRLPITAADHRALAGATALCPAAEPSAPAS